MEVYLEHLKGERAGALDHFSKDVIRVGRSSDLDLIFDDQGVSYEHAELRLRDGDFWLVDLGSTNGSFVNDERAQNARLKEGDQVRFGKKGPVVRFRLTPAPGAAIAPPADPFAAPSSDVLRPAEGVLADLPPLAPAAGSPPRRRSKRMPTMPEVAALGPAALGLPGPPPPVRGTGRLQAIAQVENVSDAASSEASSSGASSSGASSSGATSNVDPAGAGVRRPPIVVAARPSRGALLAALLCASVAVLAGSLAFAFHLEVGRKQQLYQDEVEHAEQLRQELATARRSAADHDRDLEERLREEAHEEVDRLERQLDKSKRSEHETLLKLDDVTRQLSRARADLAQLSSAGSQRDNRMWKVVESRAARAVVLVFCAFDLKRRDGTTERFQCSGSGFFISRDGYLVTNKHVIEPWKFRPLAVRLAQEDLEVDPKTYKLAIWIAGTKFADGSTLLVENGYSTVQGTLERVREPQDRWTNLTLPGDRGPRLMKVHDDMSNEDLALLRAKGNDFEPIPLRRPTDGPVEKLDPVLLVGFPAGASILEKGIAETSAVPGVVRKVEETIYVSGGMIGGNSGGPVLDTEGRAVGVATRVVSGTESFGSCLKIEHVIDLVEGGSW